MFGGRGVVTAGGLGDELLDRGEGERGIEAALLPDRRRPLRAHAGAAERARHVPGHDADVVGQLEQPVEAVEEPLGAVACVDGEVGAGGGADEQRVAGQERVAGEKAAVLRAMARCVDRPHRDAADGDLVPVGQRLVRVGHARIAVDCDGQSLLEREAAVAGDVVGVRVGLEDARDTQAPRARPPRGTARWRAPGRRAPPRRPPRPRSGTTRSRGRRRRTGAGTLRRNVPPAPAVLLEVRAG